MKKQMYALYDSTAQIFLNPVSLTNDGDAIRWFTTMVNNDDEQSNISKYPEQFSIYRLLDYNDKTGGFVHSDADIERGVTAENDKLPRLLITGVECLMEPARKFTVKQLIGMLKMELGKENVIDIGKQVNQSGGQE